MFFSNLFFVKVESVGESVQTEVEDIGVVLEEADVLYVTRVQKERFASREVSCTCVCVSLSLSFSLSRPC